MLPIIAGKILELVGLVVQTPDQLYQCQLATFTWSSQSIPPYILSVTLSDQLPTFNPSFDAPNYDSSAATFDSFGETILKVPRRHSVSWLVDLPEGTNVTVHVRDDAGEIASSSPLVVGPGKDFCLA